MPEKADPHDCSKVDIFDKNLSQHFLFPVKYNHFEFLYSTQM